MTECKIQGCENPVKSKGLCNNHYQKDYRAKRVRTQPDFARERKLTQPHREAMGRHLGRTLHSNEQVRLKDKDGEVVVSNLEVWWKSGGPKSARVKDLVEFADAVLAMYGDERLKHGLMDRQLPPHWYVIYIDDKGEQVSGTVRYDSQQQAGLGWRDSRLNTGQRAVAKHHPTGQRAEIAGFFGDLGIDRAPENWIVLKLDKHNNMVDAGLGEFASEEEARSVAGHYRALTGERVYLKGAVTGEVKRVPTRPGNG